MFYIVAVVVDVEDIFAVIVVGRSGGAGVVIFVVFNLVVVVKMTTL